MEEGALDAPSQSRDNQNRPSLNRVKILKATNASQLVIYLLSLGDVVNGKSVTSGCR